MNLTSKYYRMAVVQKLDHYPLEETPFKYILMEFLQNTLGFFVRVELYYNKVYLYYNNRDSRDSLVEFLNLNNIRGYRGQRESAIETDFVDAHKLIPNCQNIINSRFKERDVIVRVLETINKEWGIENLWLDWSLRTVNVGRFREEYLYKYSGIIFEYIDEQKLLILSDYLREQNFQVSLSESQGQLDFWV